MKQIDISLQRFGRLIADYSIRKRDPAGRSMRYWICLCDCGNIVDVHVNSLRQGRTKSCGCLNDEVRVAKGLKHGGVGTLAYSSWLNMKARCLNENNEAYKNYGGRGIQICTRWRYSFTAFLADVGRPPSDAHSLDRFPDVNGNYEPGNVRWATDSEQARNKRQSVVIEVRGERINLADAAERYGIAYDTLHNRIKDGGWTPEQAVGLDSPPTRGGYKRGQGKRRRFDGSIREAGRER